MKVVIDIPVGLLVAWCTDAGTDKADKAMDTLIRQALQDLRNDCRFCHGALVIESHARSWCRSNSDSWGGSHASRGMP